MSYTTISTYAYVYKSLYKHKFLLLWDKALEMELLSHMVNICLLCLRNCQSVYQSGKPFCRPIRILVTLHTHQHLVLCFVNLAILMGMQ